MLDRMEEEINCATNMLQNLLRQSLYYNYDYYHDLGKGAFTNNDYVVRRHVSTYSKVPRFSPSSQY